MEQEQLVNLSLSLESDIIRESSFDNILYELFKKDARKAA